MTKAAPDTSLEERTRDFAATLAGRAIAFTKVVRLQRTLLADDPQNPSDILKWLDESAELTRDCPDLEKIRAALVDPWRRSLSTAILQLDADLRDLCTSRGWRVDGQWPDLVVDYGIAVRVDERERSVIVGDTRTGSSLAAIGKALERQVPNLLEKNFSPQRFRDTLFRAWKAATDSKGGQAPILDAYRWFVIQSQSSRFWRDAKASLFTSLSTDQFRARLSRTLEDGTRGAGSHELRLLPPLDPKDALFLYQPSERRFGYIGRIEFIEVANEAK